MAGSMAGSASWFNSPNNKSMSSAHFGNPLIGGVVDQYVGMENSAHANGIQEPGNAWAPLFGRDWANDETIQVENADVYDDGRAAPIVTNEQYATGLRLCAAVILPANPGITHLATHRSISPSSRCNCPGDRWLGKDGKSGPFFELAFELRLKTLVGECA